MKTITKEIAVFVIMAFLLCCSNTSPEEYFKVFKIDYPKIAKIMPQAEMQAEIEKVFNANDTQMFAKYERLWKVAEIDAEKHKIPLKKN